MSFIESGSAQSAYSARVISIVELPNFLLSEGLTQQWKPMSDAHGSIQDPMAVFKGKSRVVVFRRADSYCISAVVEPSAEASFTFDAPNMWLMQVLPEGTLKPCPLKNAPLLPKKEMPIPFVTFTKGTAGVTIRRAKITPGTAVPR